MIAIASLAAGCSFSSNAAKTDSNPSHDGSGSGMIDAAIDAPPDAPPDGPNMDFGPAPFTVHLSALPTAGMTLPGTINTDTSNLCATTATWVSSSQPDACFIVATTITSGGSNTVATGGKPLVLVATSAITVSKNLDVSSKRAGSTLGAGGNYVQCAAFPSNPDPDANGGGGGAGGTFMTQGGFGGIGNGDNNVHGGTPANIDSTPVVLRGGCAGQKGANGNQSAGSPGNGGGAIYLVAGSTISITTGNGINASGAGGMHGGHSSGGSAGGAGGMILLYAPTIEATGAALVANGGGASSGGDGSGNGNDGNDPSTAMTAATGGMGPGGDGGRGGILTTGGSGGGVGAGTQGGGGGGGGVGYIRSNVMLSDVIASPAPDVVP